MFKRLRFPLLLLVVLLITVSVTVLISMPAKVWITRFAPSIRFQTIEGNLWSGSLSMVQQQGIIIDQITWQWRPRALLRGVAGFVVRAQTKQNWLQSELDVHRSGQLSGRNTHGQIILEDIAAYGPQYADITTKGIANISGVVWEKNPQNWGVSSGQIQANIAVRYGAQQWELGEWSAILKGTPERLVAQISAKESSPLYGQLQAILSYSSGVASLAGTMGAHAHAPEPIKNALGFIGQVQADGQVAIQMQHTFNTLP